MIPLLLSLIALIAYIFGGINSSVFISNKIFQKDVRRYGSHNASFANFIQVFGQKWGAAVILIDVVKTAIPCFIGMLLMKIPGSGFGTLGVLFAGFCTVLGDCYPWRFRFKGNFGVVSCLTALWIADWRVGLLSSAVYGIVLAFTRLNSLAGMLLAFSGSLFSWCFVSAENCKGLCGLLALFSAVVIIFRQREALLRILNGRESRVHWGKKAEDLLKEDRF